MDLKMESTVLILVILITKYNVNLSQKVLKKNTFSALIYSTVDISANYVLKMLVLKCKHI